ncbi:MAG TPA: hypothetical protein ACFYEK_14735 [Candidatus Wunengus sp. YC60]|uniref:hypothetical protein n=1 Tax=Candidatus Wunengus sp. YC60 TaxID=3367697 RepID=UPI004026A2C3
MKVLIDIQDDKKANDLLAFLKEIPFVRIEKKVEARKTPNLDEIFGLWRNRDITKESLREKAWRM